MIGSPSRAFGALPFLVLLLLFLIVLAASSNEVPVLAEAEPPPGYRILDPTRVYHGDPTSFARPAVIALDDVFRAIPEYKKILEEPVNQSDARYWILLEAANKRFAKAVKGVAALGAYDLIAERGVLVPKDPTCVIPDVTLDAIRLAVAG